MFRKLAKKFLPNPLDWHLKKVRKKGGKKILLAWNRGLGDIALGLYAIVHRIYAFIPDAKITFLIRENLKSGFSLLEGVDVLVAPSWKRGVPYDVEETLQSLKIDPKSFDLILEKPSPTDWVYWQRGVLTPKLRWSAEYDALHKKFPLKEGITYIGVQVEAETQYGLWRNWPKERWNELFSQLEEREDIKFLLFGFGKELGFTQKNILDFRGKTTLFELLSLIKNRCSFLILPDSGILSMVYYLNTPFPLKVLSLWADPKHGILKQNVSSPNPLLKHTPLIGADRDLSKVQAREVLDHLFPVKPVQVCKSAERMHKELPLERVGAILLAGGQGSRLNHKGPKGTFSLLGRSLFAWNIEKAPAQNFPIAVMTSLENHEETLSFFAQNNNFGREVYFFSQEMLPFLDRDKKELPFLAPTGNGSVFTAFARSKLLELFQQKGVEDLFIFPVENPLVSLLDAKLLTHHRRTKAEITLQCIPREEEAMGALVERKGKIEILEYFYQNSEEKYFFSYTGVLAMQLSFFAKMAEKELPVHLIEKNIPFLQKSAFKREKFIFEVFPFAKKVEALSFLKKNCYAPIKTLDNVKPVEKILETSSFCGQERK